MLCPLSLVGKLLQHSISGGFAVMRDRNKSGQSGASLIEILVVMAIAAVLVTAAVTKFGNSNRILDRQNIARGFKVALERARFDSVKRHATSTTDQSRIAVVSAT